MIWKLEWVWESDTFYGSDSKHFDSDSKHFDNEKAARDFVKKLKKNPHRKIISAYLTHTTRII